MRLRAQKWNVGPERRKGLGTSRAYVWGNARHFCEAEPDYTGCEAERQKPRMISQCEVILLRSLSPAKFIRHS